jgi:hypothetical protein
VPTIAAMTADFADRLGRATVVAMEPLKLPSGRLVAAEPPGLFGPGRAAGFPLPVSGRFET